MKVSMREGVSLKRVKRAWKALKDTLEYVHLTDFLLHVSHSDALALLILAFTRPLGWLAIVFLALVWSYWLKRQISQEEVLRMDDKKDERPALPVAKVEAAEVTITAPNVPQNLVDLAKQGIGSKITITIELKPSA